MNINLKEKINQLFIIGYDGDDFKKNQNFCELLKNNLGGVIFFTQNIIAKEQFKNQIEEIKKISKTKPFLSIDEEGGRVERFENINSNYPNHKKYLSAKYIAQKGENAVIEQTLNISKELKQYGINMNFAPVLDVNSNPDNPIIGERSYSDNPKEVTKYALLTNKIYNQNGIITVGKHFPGHGDTKKDSHKEMPIVDLDFETFKKIHLYPFEKAVEQNIPALMVAHVHYSCFDNDNIPASLSKNVLAYLKNEMNYNGLIVSDDMVMGGITQFKPIYAIKTMLNNGINCFIYRSCTDKVVEMINNLYELAKDDKELQNSINETYEKIITLKKVFDIL